MVNIMINRAREVSVTACEFPFLFSRVLLCGPNKDALIWIVFRCATVYNASLGLLFATPPPRLWPGVEGYRCVCVALGLLPWHSVVETTMPEPVRQWRVWFRGGERRGAFTPWHRTWHRARPSCLPGLLAFRLSSESFSTAPPWTPSILHTPHSS